MLLVLASAAVFGWRTMRTPATKPASEWTVCGNVQGFSESTWRHEGTSARWMDYMLKHSCTFKFIGWDANMVLYVHEHPDTVSD